MVKLAIVIFKFRAGIYFIFFEKKIPRYYTFAG